MRLRRPDNDPSMRGSSEPQTIISQITYSLSSSSPSVVILTWPSNSTWPDSYETEMVLYYLRPPLEISTHSTSTHSTADRSTPTHSTADHSTPTHSTASHSTATHSVSVLLMKNLKAPTLLSSCFSGVLYIRLCNTIKKELMLFHSNNNNNNNNNNVNNNNYYYHNVSRNRDRNCV